jgi:hypothetical protein
VGWFLSELANVTKRYASRSRFTTSIKDRILAQSKPVADFPIRLTFVDKLEHFECETIRLDALTWGSMSTTPWRGGMILVDPDLMVRSAPSGRSPAPSAYPNTARMGTTANRRRVGQSAI